MPKPIPGNDLKKGIETRQLKITSLLKGGGHVNDPGIKLQLTKSDLRRGVLFHGLIQGSNFSTTPPLRIAYQNQGKKGHPESSVVD